MVLAPFRDLNGVQHSASPSHQTARQAERVFFRGARSSDGVPVQSPIEIVCCPTHASTIAGSVSDAERPRGGVASPGPPASLGKGCLPLRAHAAIPSGKDGSRCLSTSALDEIYC